MSFVLRARLVALSLGAALATGSVAGAQQDSAKVRPLEKVTVTATRTPTTAFNSPLPVNIIDSSVIHDRQPNTAVDLFREQPGLDVNGVGTNQVRPTIRGMRGQRILLLEDGLRLNNARRQQDFGELPAIVDVNEIDRVDVVRGPLSVLYGTDAIGGVVNIITSGAPPRGTPAGLHGSLGYRYSSADDQRRPSGVIEQRVGRWGFRLSGSYRQTDSYEAPAGSFGTLVLPATTKVNDTGVRDHDFSGSAGVDLTATQRLFGKVESYHANNAGFGYVDPSVLGTDQPLIAIRYPKQNVDRYTLGYRANSLGTALADRAEITTYYLRNARDLDQHVFVPFGPGTPPGAGVDVLSHNFTDIATFGARAEATKILFGRHLLTYGADAFRDRSNNSDSSTTVVLGFGPPRPRNDLISKVPNATYRSAGVFAQTDLQLAEPLHIILGGRVQDVRADTRATAGQTGPLLSSRETPVVGTASAVYRATEYLNLIASVGRGFRSPNLVERFFNGATPEGSGYQKANPNLSPETSLNVDLGARVQAGPVAAEAFVFRNDLHNGIAIAPTADSVNRLPAFQNVNVAKLRFSGGEAQLSLQLPLGFSTSANYSRLTSKDVLNPNNPVGDTYSNKIAGELAYRLPTGRFWAAYGIRHNGEQKDVLAGSTPLGPVIPSFTVHSIRAGGTLFEHAGTRHSLTLAIDNLTNTLYSEFSNASFFRPEAGRNVIVTYGLGF
ncbi:MAG: TonB-dependent receptor [Gemmatimonadota bacterium]|nr:TonB-dependent receptor [Gemmatimonadota bacterium]